eukprot:gene17292-20631_t
MKLQRTLILAISSLCFFLCTSCKKNTTEPKIEDPKVPSLPDTVTKPPVVTGRTLFFGTGTGVLKIDGATFATKCNDLIKIKGGSYSQIEIKNISADDGCAINIVNDGLVELSGDGKQMLLSNLNNVVISGNGTAGIDKGFSFKNSSNRSVQLNGTIDKFTFQYANFQNVQDYLIAYNSTRVYNGSENSYSKQLKFLNIDCDNTASMIYFPATVASGSITGLIKDIEIAYVKFSNSPGVMSVVNLGAAEDYNIHHNIVKNINSASNNHNGIFQLDGNGKFYNNLIRDHQGNAVRSWLFSVASAVKEVQIYNNIVFNSRKYSAFEVQGFTNLVIPGTTNYANAKIFNNTCGSLDLSKDWVGVVADVYDLLGGKCEVFNNLAFNFPSPSNNNYIWSQQSAIPAVATNNLYFNNSAAAGIKDE